MIRLAILAAVVAAAVLAQTGSIDGVVVNRVTGIGIPGVSVTVFTRQAVRYEATTDNTGSFHVYDVAAGNYEARIERPGFLNMPPRAIGQVQGSVRVRFEMTPLSMLSGRVVDVDGKPVFGGEVRLGQRIPVSVQEMALSP